MSATGSVVEFMEFDDLCRGCQGYSDNLAQLFDTCDIEKGHRHKISFKQALKRLQNKIKHTFQLIKIESKRNVTKFTIGKTFVKQRIGVTFHPMKKTTWFLDGGIDGRWKSYKHEGYDGLVVIGCIERDLIPDDVMQYNKSIDMNQQIYTMGLEQALIQYYTLYKPDVRLGNKSYDTGNLSEGGYKGGIVYVAYKLEPELTLSHNNDSELIKEKSQTKVHRYVSSSYSDEFQRPAESVSFDTGQTTITTPDSTKSEQTEDDNMGMYLLKRAKLQLDKLSENVIESTATKIPATGGPSAINQIDVPTAPSLSLNISNLTNQPIKPTSTETRSDQQRTTGLNVGETKNLTNQEKQRNKPIMKMTKEEKILILNSYINQRIKSDWDLLAETVFNERRQLKDPTINHYEKILTLRDLKGRIKKFVQGVRNGKRNNEEDPSVKALMEQIVEHKN